MRVNYESVTGEKEWLKTFTCAECMLDDSHVRQLNPSPDMQANNKTMCPAAPALLAAALISDSASSPLRPQSGP